MSTMTASQAALIPVWRDEWRAIGLSTEPADRPAAEAALNDLYTARGHAPPGLVLWVDSPAAGAIAAALLANRGQLRDQLWDQLGGQLGDQLGGQLRGQLWGQLWGQLRGQLGGQLRGQLWGQLWGQLRGQLGGQLRGQLRDQLGGQLWGQLQGQLWGQLGDQLQGQLGGQLGECGYGAHDAAWLASYDFVDRVLALPGMEAGRPLFTLARTAGWWWPFEGAVVITDRPATVAFDPQRRLHCATGPAVTWRDGWSTWAWHGYRVPEWVIDDPTLERIGAEPNIETRRCAIESYGWDRLTDQMRHVATDPYGALYDVPEELWGARQRVCVVVNGTPERDGTRKLYGLLVAPDVASPLDAVAASYGLTADHYQTIQRRT